MNADTVVKRSYGVGIVLDYWQWQNLWVAEKTSALWVPLIQAVIIIEYWAHVANLYEMIKDKHFT